MLTHQFPLFELTYNEFCENIFKFYKHNLYFSTLHFIFFNLIKYI